MSDLQCPARFVLLGQGGGTGPPADVSLRGDGDPLAELEDLADLHRGETLVVEVPASVLDRLPSSLRPPTGGSLRVEVDADGWRPSAE